MFGVTDVWFLLNIGWRLLVIAAVAAGLWTFAKHDANARRGPAFFAHTRPVNDATLAWARLGASALTILVSFVVLTLFATATHVVFAGLGLGLGGPPGRDVPTIIEWCDTVSLVFAATWVAYTRGGFVVIVVIVLSLTQEFLRDSLPTMHSHFWESTTSMPLALKLTLMVCSLILCWSFVRAFRRGVLSRRAVPILTVAWALGTLVVSGILLRILLDEGGFALENLSATTLWACSAAMALLVLTPFAATALQVNRLRHR